MRFSSAEPIFSGVKLISVWVSVLCLLFASAVALLTWVYLAVFSVPICGKPNVSHGTAIHAAILIVLVCGPVESLLIFRARSRFVPLLAGAATLGLAVALVALDSARYSQRSPETADCAPWTQSNNVVFLFLFWGVPLAVLLAQALLTLRVAHGRETGELTQP